MTTEKFLAVFQESFDGPEDLVQKRMMGGTTFLLRGNMLGGVDELPDGSDRFMFRVGKINQASALALPGTEIVKMGSRKMGGMVFYSQRPALNSALRRLMALALEFVDPMPAKTAAAKR
ncbi:MAG: RNA methyltransferase [Pseudomonadota bacterium]